MTEAEQTHGHSLFHHEQILANFAELEIVVNTILFAGIINGKYGAEQAIAAHQPQLLAAQEWFSLFSRQMLDGWLLKQKSAEYGEKGEKFLLEKLNSFTIAHHVGAESDTAASSENLSTSQFMALLAIGFLYQMKSVNYNYLDRKTNLGGNNDIAKELSFWMFNWENENIAGQLTWLKNTGHWVMEEPDYLITKHPHQFLKFGHFVSALLVVGQIHHNKSVAAIHKSERQKKTQDKKNTRKPYTILLPSGMSITDSENNSNGEVPGSISDFIEGLTF